MRAGLKAALSSRVLALTHCAVSSHLPDEKGQVFPGRRDSPLLEQLFGLSGDSFPQELGAKLLPNWKTMGRRNEEVSTACPAVRGRTRGEGSLQWLEKRDLAKMGEI